MRKNYGVKPCAYPMPVFIIATYDENGVPDAMNAAWGGIAEENKINICMDPEHKTYANILKTKAFTVSMGEAKYMAECDYVGIVSANDEPDKLKKSGFHTTKSELVNAPIIDELSVCMECRFVSFDESDCRLVGEIVNVSVDERVLDEKGNPDIKKIEPIAFDAFNSAYVKLTETIGDAFSIGNIIADR